MVRVRHEDCRLQTALSDYMEYLGTTERRHHDGIQHEQCGMLTFLIALLSLARKARKFLDTSLAIYRSMYPDNHPQIQTVEQQLTLTARIRHELNNEPFQRSSTTAEQWSLLGSVLPLPHLWHSAGRGRWPSFKTNKLQKRRWHCPAPKLLLRTTIYGPCWIITWYDLVQI